MNYQKKKDESQVVEVERYRENKKQNYLQLIVFKWLKCCNFKMNFNSFNQTFVTTSTNFKRTWTYVRLCGSNNKLTVFTHTYAWLHVYLKIFVCLYTPGKYFLWSYLKSKKFCNHFYAIFKKIFNNRKFQ